MLWTSLIGFLIGVVAKILILGENPGGFFATVLLGIGCALLASFVGNSFSFYRQGEMYSFFGAVAGAIVILFVYGVLTRNKKIGQS